MANTQTVAISYFDNTSGLEEYNPLSKGLADMLITDLSNVKSIQIVEREKLESLLKEIDLGEGKFIDESTAQKLGKGLGAGYMLTGSYLIMGETMRIDVRLVNVGTGEVSMGEEITGEKNTFFELEKDLVEKLIKALNLTLSKSEQRRIKKVQTESFDSFNAYSTALDSYDKGEYEESQAYLEKAVDIDSDFENALDRLDEIEQMLDELEQARGTGLTLELINKINLLSDLRDSDCEEFAEEYRLLTGVVISYVDESYSYNSGEYDIDIDSTLLIDNWTNFLLPQKPNSYDESIAMLSHKAFEAYKILELLLSKSYSNRRCGSNNPNLVAMEQFTYLLSKLYGYYSSNNIYNKPLNLVNKAGEVAVHAKDFPSLIVKYGTKANIDFPLKMPISNEYLKSMISIVENQDNSSSAIINVLKLSDVKINIDDFVNEKHLWIDALDITDLSSDPLFQNDPRTVQNNYETVFTSFLFDSGPKPQLNIGYPDIWNKSLKVNQIYFIF